MNLSIDNFTFTGVSESNFTDIYRQIPVCTSTAISDHWTNTLHWAKDHRKILRHGSQAICREAVMSLRFIPVCFHDL